MPPCFLFGYPAYENYVSAVVAGKLPNYEYENGVAIVHPGKVYCRHDKCKHQVNRVSA